MKIFGDHQLYKEEFTNGVGYFFLFGPKMDVDLFYNYKRTPYYLAMDEDSSEGDKFYTYYEEINRLDRIGNLITKVPNKFRTIELRL